jgi:hypothetical protein
LGGQWARPRTFNLGHDPDRLRGPKLCGLSQSQTATRRIKRAARKPPRAAPKKSPAHEMARPRGCSAPRAGGHELSALVDRKHVLDPNQSGKFRAVACRLRCQLRLDTRDARRGPHGGAGRCRQAFGGQLCGKRSERQRAVRIEPRNLKTETAPGRRPGGRASGLKEIRSGPLDSRASSLITAKLIDLLLRLPRSRRLLAAVAKIRVHSHSGCSVRPASFAWDFPQDRIDH